MISVANYEESIKRVNLSQLPKVYQEGHEFFLEASEWYDQDTMVKESIDLYIQKLNQHLESKKVKTNRSKEVVFIKRFIRLHDKTLGKLELGQFIKSLQQAIIKKQIRKSSLYALQIVKIQDKLIQQYNTMEDDAKLKISINEEWLQELNESIAESTGLHGIPEQTRVKLPVPKAISIFDSMNEIKAEPSENSFRLLGDLGKLLGDLERFELAITLEGDQGGGKTRFGYQLADSFAALGNRIAVFSLEIGKRSDLIRRMREEYVHPSNQDKIFITDQLPDGFETIRKSAKDFDVVIIDSWNKLNVHSSLFDKLRKEFPDTIFIVIFQRTTQGTIRGGTAPLFDAGINLEVVKVDDTFRNNYAVATKNRYGETGLQYNIHSRQLLQEDFIEEGDE